MLAFAFLEFNATHRVLSLPMSRSIAEFHFVTFCYSSPKRTRHSVADSEEFLPCTYFLKCNVFFQILTARPNFHDSVGKSTMAFNWYNLWLSNNCNVVASVSDTDLHIKRSPGSGLDCL